jgi:uncharacterized tellurite resistance protein B-like protein
MLARIKEFFNDRLGPEAEVDTETRTRLAVAALLVEVAQIDYADDPREVDAVRAALRGAFGLDEGEIDELVHLAHEEMRDAVSNYQFTSLIQDQFDAEQRLDLLRGLWQVAFADGRLDKYEEHLIRRVADLLYIRHSDFIRIKHEVMQSAG